jgi:F-type H+-transporting ATPase subunit gamma
VPSQREIRRRIGSVGNIKQITRAMQFVAASKLRRAQDATLASRPYSDKLDEVLADVAAVIEYDQHPLLADEREGIRLIVLFTSDRGMAGSLNTNTIRFAAGEIAREPGDLQVVTVGRKGTAAMRRAHVPLAASFEGLGDKPAFTDILPLARLISDDFLAGTYSKVHLLYPAFISTLVQRPAMKRLLPVKPNPDSAEGVPGGQFIFEPDPTRVLEQLMPRYVATRLFQAVLELTASEQSSRMVAMRSATDNAQELIDDLTLTYNKVRQSNITREMVEIATGASSTQ